jgi:hypothetical protein
MVSELREASWSAAALCRFRRLVAAHWHANRNARCEFSDIVSCCFLSTTL